MGMFSPKGNRITAEEYISKYGLEELSNQRIVRKIAKDLAGSGLTKDKLLDKASPQLKAEVLYWDTIVEQNWLILKQLEKLNNKG
jgi:hypothetical protein